MPGATADREEKGRPLLPDLAGVRAGADTLSEVADHLKNENLFAFVEKSETLDEARDLLHRIGAELVCVSESSQAQIEQVRGASLLLLETRIGAASGIEHCRNLKEQGLDIPVIFLSEENEAAVYSAAAEFGADIIFRPFNASELVFRCYRQLLTRSPQREPPRREKKPGQVLLAEDDPLTATLLEKSLSNAGFNVMRVSDGDQALAALRRHEFDAVVLDVEMPGTDGYGVLQQLRLGQMNARTPALMLTSRSQERDIILAFELGADDYVQKPYNPLELVTRLRRLMSRR